MPEIIRAIAISPDGSAEVKQILSDLETLQGLVGGDIQIIVPTQDLGYQWCGYVNEEGKPRHLPVNRVANEIAELLGWEGRQGGDFLVGTMVIVGPGDGETDSSVGDDVIELVRDYFWRHGEPRRG